MASSITTLPNTQRLALQVDQQLGDFHLAAELDLPAAGVSGLFGPSGSGKTSLLRLIAGLEKPKQGIMTLGGQTLLDTQKGIFVPPHRRRIGVVFQEARLFPHYRVRGNLTYGMRSLAPQRFDEIVELLGIEALLERMPGMLSGGEARRVAIGRALLSEPQLLLMDEPLTGLDGARKDELLRYITRLTQQVDIPVIYVSHDAKEITDIADHLVVLKAGQVRASDKLGALLQRFDLTHELGGFDAASLLEGIVVAHDEAYGLTHLALDNEHQLVLPGTSAPMGSRIRVRILARDIALALTPPANTSYRNQLNATISDFAILPEAPYTVELHLRIGTFVLRARLTRKSWDEMGLKQGMQVTALIRSVSFNAL
ncbi:molybdenum ABC transporter ATP-binding protein [Vreelandella populi]|uniref:Molybdenum ABC transporter ATP-binding protein n=1 Tax=Vreelandella populi TaxID=2498858 RepID=A0A433LBZ0_9GAMM|nr:molybdenum ABC transporter ATP-binding protein [Halomonas populi]RUR46290.1 molybdenum ABC transporter ATP-binding protein [Halomonas populi]RUR53212.1 molybdenum ABC transporter ATP-binding protein [Halomonas populi]